MGITESVELGREAYEHCAWEDSYKLLSEADTSSSLEAADVERLAFAAYLTGRDDVAVEDLERAYQAYLEQDASSRSVQCAFWLGITLMLGGEHARGGGWLGRAQRLVEERLPGSVEEGYLLIPAGLQALGSGDPAAAHETFGKATAIAKKFNDADLVALGQLGVGQSLVAMGEPGQGVALLDEAMLCVTTGEVSPVAAGIVYCAVILACRDIFDLGRAEEWTAALSRWCEKQQGLRPYRGQCMVHRSEIMHLHGQWSDAMTEVLHACEHFSTQQTGQPAIGMAHYQRGEILRLRGKYAEAEDAYRQASALGHPVHPGMALLRLAQGNVSDAYAAIRRVVSGTEGPVGRPKVLAALVPIALAADDTDTARLAVAELDEVSGRFRSPYLQAMAGLARGTMQLHDGEYTAACATLLQARAAWQDVDAPYEAARLRVLMARAYQALGDHDTAELELDAAGHVFEQLGAEPDLVELSAISHRAATHASGGLSRREVEVIRLVATGATNRQIAQTLVISEKTVARHISNIFNKLGLSSRTAAAAYAYAHGLV